MTEPYSSEDVVTVIRLVSLGRGEDGDTSTGIVTTVGQASMRRDGDSVYLVTNDEPALRRLRAGDIVHWATERFGVIWLAERQAGDNGVGV
jgi:hypothetical protein